MSDRQTVLAKYPNARVVEIKSTYAPLFVVKIRHNAIGEGQTLARAWASAVRWMETGQ